MNKSRLQETILLLSILFVSSVPAMAAVDKAKSTDVPANKTDLFYQKQLSKADKMMGQIALARKSLEIGLDQDASYHIAKAQDEPNQAGGDEKRFVHVRKV